MSDLSTKPAKEEELDLIFAEEFSCDPNFTLQYFREAFPAIGNVKIEDVAIQPKLHDGGYGDLLVLAKANGKSHALLIEHKISAGPTPGRPRGTGITQRICCAPKAGALSPLLSLRAPMSAKRKSTICD